MNEKAKKLMNAVYRDEQKDKIEKMRMTFTEVTSYVIENLKDSREKSLTVTKLEEACMWAIKSITREGE